MLLAVRDDLAAAASLVVALMLSCRALDVGRRERSALVELGGIASDRLDAVLAALDAIIANGNAT